LLTVNVSPNVGGTIQVGEVTADSYPYTRTYHGGVQVKLEAMPAAGYVFTNWSGALSDDINPTTVVIDCTKIITAHFSKIVHTLTMQTNGNGSINPSVGTYEYSDGAVVSITATPNSGWQFDSWTGGIADPSSTTTTLVIDSDKTVTANFSQIPSPQVSWPLVGSILGVVVLAGMFSIIFVIRRRAH
jgi:hypothetical protein